jgi:DNA repair protein RecN (Recombination protein N)
MLKTLRIRSFAIIEDLTVDFGAGLNVMTGETGAGKSIVVDALGLAAGDRADTSMIRSGEDRAVVEAVFVAAADSEARVVLGARGIDLDGDEVVVRREIAASGGGRVFINGSPSTVTVLREFGDLIVELHGQHEHQSLLSAERHRDALDLFGAHEKRSEATARAHAEVLEARKRLQDLRDRSRERESLAESLRLTVTEIDAVAPRPGELDELDRERSRLQNAEQIATALGESVRLLYEGDPTAGSMAAGAARHADTLAGLDPDLAEVAARIRAAGLELEDAGSELRDYRDGNSFDPARLEEVETRRAVISNLLLRYGPDERAAIARRDEAATELDELGDLETEETRATEAVAGAERQYVRAAAALSKARVAAAKGLAPRVEKQLGALALGKARFRVETTSVRGAETIEDRSRAVALHPRGAERVEFLLAANPGEEPRPLARVASGGELSRVMLALHVVLEQAGGERVLVFDEVDAGVGGATADAVGARLAGLGALQQVLCVTHLPQVAAHAEHHYHVRKRVVAGRTRAELATLDGDERVDELARMLGGKEITAASRRNAAELLSAASTRTADGRTRGRET